MCQILYREDALVFLVMRNCKPILPEKVIDYLFKSAITRVGVAALCNVIIFSVNEFLILLLLYDNHTQKDG